MNMNEGTIDRVVRIVLGVVLLYVGIMVVGGVWGIVIDVLGAIALLTGIVGFCPLYKLFGDFTTAKK